MATYFGFALADSMFQNFDGDVEIRRNVLHPEDVRYLAMQGSLIPCLNAFHEATVTAMRERFGIDVEIPASPPQIVLERGDAVIVMGVRGLTRLTDRHHYTEEEIEAASFAFGLWTVAS